MDFRRHNFGLFKKLLGGIPWARALEGRGVQEFWSLFKHQFLHAQDQCIPPSKKSIKGGRRATWMNKKLLAELTANSDGTQNFCSTGRERSTECRKRDRALAGIKECCQSMQGCDKEG